MPAITIPRKEKKRKLHSKFLTRKKIKVSHKSLDDLPWKAVVRPGEAGLGDDGILELEELECVEVVYENTDRGRVATFKAVEGGNQQGNLEESEPEQNEPVLVKNYESDTVSSDEAPETFDSENLLPKWHTYSLHPQLLKTIHSKGFTSPTPIQAATLPIGLAKRDVIGIAQTGSGKTLAYGLPILNDLLSQPRPRPHTKRRVRGLILAPTRELALQVSIHLNSCLGIVKDSRTPTRPGKSGEKETATGKSPPQISVAAIVGGMSSQKQRRVLDRGVDILVATPGRLWDILEDDDSLTKDIKNLRFLVLDEADRMIEAGHFAELENILRLTLRQDKKDQIDAEIDGHSKEKDLKKDGLQTFIFSATLSKDLQRNLKKRSRPKGTVKQKKQDRGPSSTLDDLLLRLDFRDPDPQIIDQSPTGGVVSTLQESKIECLSSDKDVYLYYFLLRYPGKSLVFLSSVDGIRRLLPLMELLNIKAFPLHSQLEQRQRLKNLDRFTNTPNAVLLATDIAARGLDIPAIDHVVHYQIPRTTDSYIHRNGRTARAMLKGFSLLMCSPDEKRIVKALLHNLGRQELDIKEIEIELHLLDKLKYRVQLARKIDVAQHKIAKANHEKNWLKETAAAMEIELDSDYFSDSDTEDHSTRRKQKAQEGRDMTLKAELKQLLAQPLMAQGVSAKYITSGSRPIVDNLLDGTSHESLIGLRVEEAASSNVKPKQKKKTSMKQVEAWGGIE